MTTPLTIDFVSDIACPWCAVGLGALEQALQSAQQLLASSRKGVLAGSRTQTDVLNALQREAEARRDLAQARYQLLIARQKLRTLCGVAPEQAIATTQSQLLVPPR